MNRRQFLTTSSTALAAAGFGIHRAWAAGADPIGSCGLFLQKELLPEPVIIESLDLFERGCNWFARAR